MNITFDKYPFEFSLSFNERLSDIAIGIPQVIRKSFPFTFCCI